MSQKFLFTALGQDRPGLTASFLTIIYKFGANVEESYTKVISGQFLLAVAASFPDNLDLAGLRSQLKVLETDLAFPVAVKELAPARTTGTEIETLPYLIVVLGADQPGIMYHVTALLAEQKVNITNTESRVIGTQEKPAYAMVLEVEIPSSVEISVLTGALDRVATELKVEIELKPIEVMAL